ITFTHQTSELGEKEVQFHVADGSGDVSIGTLTVKVEPAGSQKPVGTPDFETAFTGREIVVKPRVNDISPSGVPLASTGVEAPASARSVPRAPAKGVLRFSASEPGVSYVASHLVAGSAPSVGIIRVDVKVIPVDSVPPIAVKDTAYLRGDEPTTVSVL